MDELKKSAKQLTRKNIFDAPFMKEMLKATANMYRLGWDERNGGNISYLINEKDVAEYLDPDEVIRTIPTGFDAGKLIGKIFIVTGTGKYFKKVDDDPETNLGIIRIAKDGTTAELLWGYKDGGRFTSELPAHLMSHISRLGIDPAHRVVIHSHPTYTIAMNAVCPLDEKDFTHRLWRSNTESIVVFPDGVGILPCMVCGTNEIGEATAEKMKKMIQRTGAAYKEQSGALSAATLDRAENAITYRVFGREKERQNAYEENLSAYEKAAVRANIWNTAMPPVYRVISMAGVLFILYFGQKNVLGTGWRAWGIAAFTTFLSCFVKLSVKSSSAAKLFNAVHKAQVSWNRIKPLLTRKDERTVIEDQTAENHARECREKNDTVPTGKTETTVQKIQISHLNFAYPDGKKILDDICLYAEKGQIIGITGAVACGKSTLGKVFLCEYPYEGQILVDGTDLQAMDEADRTKRIGYLGHDPELFFDSVENNILLGEKKEADDYLKAVCMEQEVAEMEDGKQTAVGNGGVRLSGGQAKRLALARTLCHKKPVLILDDPFSALDKNTEKQIFANLKQQTKDNIVFLISHRLYLFPQMNQVIWMEDGKAVAGTHEEILEKIPEYRSLYETQSDERENAKVETENRKTVSEHTEERRSGR